MTPGCCELHFTQTTRVYNQPVSTLGVVPLDPDAARELSRAARMAHTWRENRDRLIRQAHADGAGLREIARLVGLTHPAISKIVAKGDTDDDAT